MRPKRPEPSANGHATDLMGRVPTAAELEAYIAEHELAAQRGRTLLAAVRQMSGSRQPIQSPPGLVELDETA